MSKNSYVNTTFPEEDSLFDCCALIVSLAGERGVDACEWFLEGNGEEGGSPTPLHLRPSEFANRLSSLAFGVTVNESSKTMLEIERGLSDAAIKTVVEQCGNDDGVIDVGLFLTECNKRITGGNVRSGGVTSPLPSPKPFGNKSSFFSFDNKVISSPYDEEVVLFDADGADDLGLGAADIQDEIYGAKGDQQRPTRLISTRKILSSRIGKTTAGASSGGSGARSSSAQAVSSSSRARPSSAPAAATVSVSAGAGASGEKQVLLQTSIDVVEDLMRAIARRPDQYYQVQLCLGWLTSPGKTAAIETAGPWIDQWLETKVVRSAFLSGAKLRLTDAQSLALVELVAAFANERLIIKDKDSQVAEAASSLGLDTKASASGPLVSKKQKLRRQRLANKVVHLGRLSGRWLREYLEHLRLHNRLSSALSETLDKSRSAPRSGSESRPRPKSATVTVSSVSATHSSALDNNDSMRTAALPSELRRALSGRPHGITGTGELKALLRRHPLLTDAQLAQEVHHRVLCWRADICCSGGFGRALRLAADQWARGPQHARAGIDGGWSRMPELARAQVALELEAQVLRERQEKLFSSERLSLSVTMDLFNRFDAFCRESNYAQACSWEEWLEWWQVDKAKRDALIDVERLRRETGDRLAVSMGKAATRPKPTSFAFVVPVDEAPPSPAKVARQGRLAARRGAGASGSASASASASGSASEQPAGGARAQSASVGRPGAAPHSSGAKGLSRAATSAPSPRTSTSAIPSSPARLLNRPSLGQTHGAELRDTLASARSALMAAGLGKDHDFGFSCGSLDSWTTFGGLEAVIAPLDVGLPPDSPRPSSKKVWGRKASKVAEPDKSTESSRIEAKKKAALRRWAARKATAQRAAAAEEVSPLGSLLWDILYTFLVLTYSFLASSFDA